MTQEFKTTKGSFLIVKVPEDTCNYVVRQNAELSDLWYDDNNNISKWIDLPIARWQIVGDPFGLTEERYKELAMRSDRHPDLELYIDHMADSTRYVYLLKSAKEGFISLLNSLKIYQTNPIRKPEPQFDERGNGGYCQTWINDYEEAQERTGSFILLKKI